jgi:predicted dinucleotide-binding enzyme
MRIGIIGSGNIGGTVAKLLARTEHAVAVSHSRPVEALRALVAQLGPNARATTVEDAASSAEVVLLAIPWRNRGVLPAEALRGKIVIDAMNPYAPDFSVYDLGDSTSSEMVADVLPGARIVKAFNTMHAKDLATRGLTDLPVDERPALFLAGDDAEAKTVVARLIEEIGFAPVDTGSLRDGGRLQQPGSPIYARLMTGHEAHHLLAGASGTIEADPHPS